MTQWTVFLAALLAAATTCQRITFRENRFLPDVPNIPYDPARVLKAVAKKDTLPKDEFWFVVWGDSKTANLPSRNNDMETMLRTILAMRPLPVLAFECGDLVSGDGTDENYWIGFENCANGLFRRFRRKVAYWPTLGDHDDPTGWDGRMYLEFFRLPEIHASDYGFAPKYDRILTEKCWSFDYKNAHFVSFNAMPPEGSRGDAVIMRWMREDLRKTTKKWVFIFSHRPATHKFTKDYLALFEEFRATALFAGHVHEYRRFKRKPGRHCTYITQGSCTNPVHGEPSPDSVAASKEKSFTKVHVLADRCEVETVTIDGKKTLDRFVLTTTRRGDRAKSIETAAGRSERSSKKNGRRKR